MSGSVVVHHPKGRAQQALLLFHGVGSTSQDLVPLGRVLSGAFPDAFVVSIEAPHGTEGGRGYQWFPVAGVSEANRPARVAQAMPAFLAEVARWQAIAGLGPEATALVGFSQGGIMALESTKVSSRPAQRVVALGGRFAQLPVQLAPHTTVHMIHGKEDRVMPYALAVSAAERLVELGTDVTLDVLPFTGHEVTEDMGALLVERLKGYLPQWRWRLAVHSDPGEAAPPTLKGNLA